MISAITTTMVTTGTIDDGCNRHDTGVLYKLQNLMLVETFGGLGPALVEELRKGARSGAPTS